MIQTSDLAKVTAQKTAELLWTELLTVLAKDRTTTGTLEYLNKDI